MIFLSSHRVLNEAAAAAFCFFFLAASARASVIYFNGVPDQADGANITGFIAADDFTLGAPSALTGGTFWSSANFDPFADSFSGILGWAILNNNGGAPGVILFSGSDSSPVLTDTGNQIFGTEEWRIDFSFGSINLGSGTYWLALHEGPLGTPDDGTTIYWDTTSSQAGALSEISADLTGSSGWAVNSGLRSGGGSDLVFALNGSGVTSPVPEPSTLALTAGVLTALGIFMRRRA